MKIKRNGSRNEGKTTRGIYIKGTDWNINKNQELIVTDGLTTKSNVHRGTTDIKETDSIKLFFKWFYTGLLLLSLFLGIISIFTPVPWYIWGALPITYTMYFINAFYYSNTWNYLNAKQSTSNIIKYVKGVKMVKPYIGFTCDCYHYESRTQTKTDSDGRSYTESYEEKVTTYRGKEKFNSTSWKDVSPTLRIASNIAKMKFVKTFTLGNELTKALYHSQKSAFDDRYRNKDTRYASGIEYEIYGFRRV